MDVNRILNQLDTEITRLQQIRSALAGVAGVDTSEPKRRGRPKGSKTVVSGSAPKKRTMSPEARQRIADAQEKRWAAHKKGVLQ